jgi:hypothetical protein
MARLGRKVALPVEIRSGLRLADGERVLAAAALVDGRWVVATTQALQIVAADSTGERHGWDQVAGAVWSDTASMLQVTWADQHSQLVLELAGDAGFLPEVIRERVEASVVVSRRIGAGGRRGVRVAVRRAGPGAPLTTQVVADRGVDLTEPELATRIAAELADLREQTGMTDLGVGAGLPRLDSNQRPSD